MKAKITFSYPRMFVHKGERPEIRDIKVGEIVDAIVNGDRTEVYFNDFCRVNIFGDAFKDKGPMQLEAL